MSDADRPWDAPKPKSPGQAGGDLSRRTKIWLGAAIAFAVVAIGVAVALDEPEPDVGDSLGAEGVCREYVKDRLKAPATASFSGEESFTLDDSVWTAKGAVDSENSFGAKVRNRYECEVRYAGDQTWNLVTLDLQ